MFRIFMIVDDSCDCLTKRMIVRRIVFDQPLPPGVAGSAVALPKWSKKVNSLCRGPTTKKISSQQDFIRRTIVV